MMAYSSEIIRSLVALCELIKKVFLTLKVIDSSSWTLYLRKLKCYDSGYRGPLLMSRKQARASPWKRGVTAGPGHVTSSGLLFEVPAENSGAKCHQHLSKTTHERDGKEVALSVSFLIPENRN